MFVGKPGGKSISRYAGRDAVCETETVCGEKDGRLLTHNLAGISRLVNERIEEQPVIVVSAANNTTDLLEEAAYAACRGDDYRPSLAECWNLHELILGKAGIPMQLIEQDLADVDKILREVDSSTAKDDRGYCMKCLDSARARGEMMAAKFVSKYLKQSGINAVGLNAFDIGMLTDSKFNNAVPLKGVEHRLKKNLKEYVYQGSVPVVTGYIGKNKRGEMTTLGRGGSDWTGTMIADALEAVVAEFWKDVDGVKRADPAIIGKDVETVNRLSYRETEELSYRGARVFYHRTMEPLTKGNIPARMINMYNIGGPETWIDKKGNPEGGAKIIVCNEDVNKVTLHNPGMREMYGYAARVFDVYAKYRQPVGVIATSEAGISVTVNQDEDTLEQIKEELGKLGDVSVEGHKAAIAVVGQGMHNTPGIAGKVFSSLGDAGINVEMISQGGSEVNISFVVAGEEAHNAVRAVYNKCFNNCKQQYTQKL